MKITNIETLIVDAGWRPWIFVKIETDEGITGWGECSDGMNPYGIAGTVTDLAGRLLGEDPRAYEMRWWDMLRGCRPSPGGIAAKAMAGLELAMIDIKAKALGIPVVELFGGPTRDRTRVYWSHCGNVRARMSEPLGVPPLRTWADVTALGKEVVARGYTAFKSNILLPGEPGDIYVAGFGKGPGNTDGVVTNALLHHIETLVGTFRDAVGPDIDINLDLNFNFKPEACLRIARVLEQFNLLWLEIDMYDPQALRQIKESTSTPICTGESLYQMAQFIPYFKARSADVFMVDVPWNGFAQSKKVGDLAEVYQFNLSPHNYYSHLSSFISAALCAVLPNVRIMESEVEDVGWKEALVTALPQIVDGHMITPTGPGWGADIVEEVARAHPWEPGRQGI